MTNANIPKAVIWHPLPKDMTEGHLMWSETDNKNMALSMWSSLLSVVNAQSRLYDCT